MSHGYVVPSNLLRLIRVLGVLCVVYASLAPANASAQGRRRLPAPLCALVTGQVICYDQNAQAQPVTPPGQRVIDFAIAPDDNWIAYRTDNIVTLAPIYGSTTTQQNQQGQQIDTQATPSATLDLTMTTLVWSPDGLTVAYVIANGFRVAIPTENGKPQLISVEDRLAINLRFSPNGSRLAAQADDGTWSLYTVDPFANAANTANAKQIQRTGTIDQAADVAWQDENALVVALVAGGLYQIDAANPSARPAWTVPSEHFIKLITTATREVLALHPDPRDTIGNVVSISSDGKVTPVGASKIDSQAEWGLSGETLVYITSGTPILIDPATGRENTLPLKSVTRLAWTRPLPPPVGTFVMDADLYFLNPDSSGVQQVWRLPRSGLDRLTQLTTQISDVRDFAISPNRAQIALTSGGRLIVVSAIDPKDERVLAWLNRTDSAQADWHPGGNQLVYADGNGLYLIATDGNSIPIQLMPKGSEQRPAALYKRPQFSPDGRLLLVEWREPKDDSFISTNVIDITANTLIPLKFAQPWNVLWGPDNMLLARAPVQVTDNARLLALRVQGGVQEEAAALTEFSWYVADARFAPDKSIQFLRRLGWEAGPDIVLPHMVSGPITPGSASTVLRPEARGKPGILSNPQLSPTGRFAVGWQRTGKIGQLVVLDLQSGSRVRIQGANEPSALHWIS
jgi:Tol biopolymer transport system component